MSKLFYFGLGATKKWPAFPNAMSLTYDDVLLMPRNSDIPSRSIVDTGVKFGPYDLRLPIISAPMDTITGNKMVRKLAELGGIGTLPRGNMKIMLELCEKYTEEKIPCVYSLGLKDGLENAQLLKKAGAKMILIDVANGGQLQVKKLAYEIKSKTGLTVIAGNIANYEQAMDYKKHGVDIARVGVGGGGLCTTRMKTGVGVPQLSAVLEATAAGLPVIADGGVKYPGDVAKAMAAGATIVMIGSMFAGTDETPGEVSEQNGRKVKYVRGQASAEYMKDNKISLSEHRTDEGIATMVETIGPVKSLVDDISGGLRSSMSYVGASDLKEFSKKAMFGLISSATQRENLPHIVFDRS